MCFGKIKQNTNPYHQNTSQLFRYSSQTVYKITVGSPVRNRLHADIFNFIEEFLVGFSNGHEIEGPLCPNHRKLQRPKARRSVNLISSVEINNLSSFKKIKKIIRNQDGFIRSRSA